MSLFYTIDDVKAHPLERADLPDTVRLICLCSYWADQASHDAGDRRLFQEDHTVDVHAFIDDFVRNAQGDRKRLDGVFVPEEDITPEDEAIGWERQRVEADVRAQLLRLLDHFADAREATPLQRDSVDPEKVLVARDTDRHDVLQRQEVIDLRGTQRVNGNNATRNGR